MAGDLVLLTGGTGYLGFVTLIKLLKTGYKVRAAIRSQSKIAKIEAAPSFKAIQASVEFVIVPDMTADRAYDEAAKGVKYIIHIASPIPTFGAEPIPEDKLEEHFVHQASKSDVGMLESAKRAGTVKRVIITSSLVAIGLFEYLIGQGGDYSTKFLPESRAADPIGPFQFEFQAYSAGKVAALDATEAWQASNTSNFDLISILPGWIFGRDELITDVESLNKGSTNAVLLGLLLGSKNESPYNGNTVLGEDVAKVHILALDPKIKGDQSFTTSIDFKWEDSIQVLQKSFPKEVANGRFSTEGKQPTLDIICPGNKTEETFGFKFTPLENVVEAVANQYLELAAKA